MARQARLVLADWPHHVIQRGHNRQPVFRAAEDFRYYLANLEEWKHGQQMGVRVLFCNSVGEEGVWTTETDGLVPCMQK
jgi:REP element-mobilizing transposase RayT